MRVALVGLISLGLLGPDALAQDGAKPKKPRLDLRATPRVAFSPVRVVLTAELQGGDALPEFNCPVVEWNWDDGSRSVRESDCEPLADGEDLERRFTADHAFARAGVYDVQVRILDGQRPLAVATARINVRPGPGDFSSVGE
jgi:hypothetical protein